MNYQGVKSVIAQDGYRLLIRFDNNEQRIFDAKELLTVGRFRELQDIDLFKKVRISFDTVEWENGLDLDPEYLYSKSRVIECEQSGALDRE